LSINQKSMKMWAHGQRNGKRKKLRGGNDKVLSNRQSSCLSDIQEGKIVTASLEMFWRSMTRSTKKDWGYYST